MGSCDINIQNYFFRSRRTTLFAYITFFTRNLYVNRWYVYFGVMIGEKNSISKMRIMWKYFQSSMVTLMKERFEWRIILRLTECAIGGKVKWKSHCVRKHWMYIVRAKRTQGVYWHKIVYSQCTMNAFEKKKINYVWPFNRDVIPVSSNFTTIQRSFIAMKNCCTKTFWYVEMFCITDGLDNRISKCKRFCFSALCTWFGESLR